MSHNDELIKIGTTTRECVKRILAAYENATETQKEEGFQWYLNAHLFAQTLADTSDYNLEQVVAAIAHLSPRVHWIKNQRGATVLVNTGEAPGMLKDCVARARVALASDDPLSTIKGPKTKSFAQNILLNDEVVTIDKWAILAAIGERENFDALHKKVSKQPLYDAFANAYKIAARHIGISNSSLQAIVWIQTRGKAN